MKTYSEFSDWLNEQEDNKDKLKNMMKEMIDNKWSDDETMMEKTCNAMKEMYNSDDEGAKKFLNDMDDYTSNMKLESYVLNTIKPRK